MSTDERKPPTGEVGGFVSVGAQRGQSVRERQSDSGKKVALMSPIFSRLLVATVMWRVISSRSFRAVSA